MVHIGRTLLFVLSLALAGCGTDVMALLREESQITWDAHAVAITASKLDLGLEKPIYDAEFAKLTACQQVDKRATEYIDNFGKLSFAAQLKSDFTRLVVFVFPVPSVENCAVAYKAYEQEYLTLSARLKELSVAPDDGD